MTEERFPRGVRAGLLALADREALVRIAAACCEEDAPVILTPAEGGTVVLQVREPIEGIRFHLGEVLVSRAEVSFRGALGWCMRLGLDPDAAFAAAVCDAECEADGPWRADIEALCRETAARRDAEAAAEWDDIAPTIVSFEELDR